MSKTLEKAAVRAERILRQYGVPRLQTSILQGARDPEVINAIIQDIKLAQEEDDEE